MIEGFALILWWCVQGATSLPDLRTALLIQKRCARTYQLSVVLLISVYGSGEDYSNISVGHFAADVNVIYIPCSFDFCSN